MTREQFDLIVHQIEARAARNPAGLKWGTGAWAVMGFAYLLFVMCGSVLLTGGLLALMIAVPNVVTVKFGILGLVLFGGLSWAIVRSLFVRMHAPQGLPLTRAEVPELFAVIDELQKALHAPTFHRVLLTGEHNAGVVQVPRLGVFGWHCNYLILGLPLLQGVSAEEFRAILAHELAHLSGAHGKFGAWIYRLRRTWEQVFEQLARQKRGGGRVLGKFIVWFWPRFNARAFVLSRAQEYEADAAAARLVSPHALATGLIRTHVEGRWLEETFWPEIFGRVKAQPTPPSALFRELGGGLSGLAAVPDATRWLTQAYHLETSNADTHPCLKDRLKAIPGLPPTLGSGAPPEQLPAMVGPDAATALLGPKLEPLAASLHEQWAQMVEPGWKEQHERTQKLSQELAKAEQSGEESPETLWKRADLVLQRDGDEAAQPLIEKLLALNPDHAAANFVRARFLLAHDDERGVEHVERAVKADPFATHVGCQLLGDFHARNGHRDALKALEKRLDEHEALMLQAQAEREAVTVKDTLLPPELSEEQRAGLVAVGEAHREIGAMHVARKQVVHFPQRPLWVVALTVKVPWWKPRSSSANTKLVEAVAEQIQLEGNFLVFTVEANLKSLGKKVARLAGTEVYRRVGKGKPPALSTPPAAKPDAQSEVPWWARGDEEE